MAVAVPPDNAVDVYTNDVGFIAIIEDEEVGRMMGDWVLADVGLGYWIQCRCWWRNGCDSLE
jgi:sulfite reductase (NADPH) hemoprotein beta-component